MKAVTSEGTNRPVCSILSYMSEILDFAESIIAEQQYAQLQRSSRETSRDPVIYDRLNVNVYRESGNEFSHTETLTRTYSHAFREVI
jgi:hypothetical protein